MVDKILSKLQQAKEVCADAAADIYVHRADKVSKKSFTWLSVIGITKLKRLEWISSRAHNMAMKVKPACCCGCHK